MSKIYVAEFPSLAATAANEGAVPILATPPTIEYNVIVSAGSSGPPQAFQPTTQFIEVSTDTTCSINIAVFGTGSAGLTNCRLNANERVIRRVPNSQQWSGASTIPQTFVPYGIYTTANA
jgi:hypothetical protein